MMRPEKGNGELRVTADTRGRGAVQPSPLGVQVINANKAAHI